MLAFLRSARPLAVAALVSVSLVACDDDPVTPDFDEELATEIADQAEAVIAPIDATTGLQANLGNVTLALLGMGGGAVSPMVPFEATSALRSPLAAVRAMPTPAAPNGILIPAELEGTTFVWNFDVGGYEASDQTGAPANGVRFVWYAVDPFSGEPVNTPLGHIDLIDESTEAASRLAVVAKRTQGNLTLADYFVQGTVTGNLSTATVTVDSEGFLSDGTDQVDFDMQIVSSGNEESGTLETTVALDADGGSIDLHSEENLVGTAYDSDASFTVVGGGIESVFAYDVTGDIEAEFGTIDGSLTVNGEEVVVVTGTDVNPQFTRPDGSALTTDELHALGRVWAAAGMTFLFALQVLFPFLFLLGA